jgi:hypothetical protein
MVDFYGLPQEGVGAWPGRAAATHADTLQKASRVEEALSNDIIRQVGNEINPARFIPFVVMHEFEGMLFSDCSAFSQGIGRADLSNHFKEIRDAFGTPEDINDSPVTCPSQRIRNLVPGYEKPLLGTLAVLEIGLTRIREQCPHFDDWLRRLESAVRV